MNKVIRFCAAGLILAGVSACAGTAEVRPVKVDVGQGLPKIPGAFAAHVQTGGWHLEADSGSFTCSLWSFDTDVNGPYAAAMREALTENLERVRFVGAPLTAEEIQTEGLDAQVVVYQGNASSEFGVQNNFFTGKANGKVSLESIVAIMTENGLSFQKTVHGIGHASDDVFTCNVIADAVGEAASEAIEETVEDAILYVREGVRSIRKGTETETTTPTS